MLDNAVISDMNSLSPCSDSSSTESTLTATVDPSSRHPLNIKLNKRKGLVKGNQQDLIENFICLLPCRQSQSCLLQLYLKT